MDTASVMSALEEATATSTPVVVQEDKPAPPVKTSTGRGGMALGKKGGKEVPTILVSSCKHTGRPFAAVAMTPHPPRTSLQSTTRCTI